MKLIYVIEIILIIFLLYNMDFDNKISACDFREKFTIPELKF